MIPIRDISKAYCPTGSASRIPVFVLVALLLLGPLLAACEGGLDMGQSAAIRVERIHALPPNPPPIPFVITALTRGQSADPAFQTAANIVGGLLEREGHPWLNPEKGYSAPWKVTLETAITPLQTEQTAEGTTPEQLEKRLTVTIRDNGRTVYQGRAALVNQSPDLAGSISSLAHALFQKFPGPQGVSSPSTLDSGL